MNRPNVNVSVNGSKQSECTYKIAVLKGNHSFVSQVTEPNCKYVIRWDFDLSKESVTIPKNCVLDFEGGSITNGLIISQKTILQGKIQEDYSVFYGYFYDERGEVLFNGKRCNEISRDVDFATLCAGDNVIGLSGFRVQCWHKKDGYNYILGCHNTNSRLGTVLIYDQYFNFVAKKIITEETHGDAALIGDYFYMAGYDALDNCRIGRILVSDVLNNDTLHLAWLNTPPEFPLETAGSICYDSLTNEIVLASHYSLYWMDLELTTITKVVDIETVNDALIVDGHACTLQSSTVVNGQILTVCTFNLLGTDPADNVNYGIVLLVDYDGKIISTKYSPKLNKRFDEVESLIVDEEDPDVLRFSSNANSIVCVGRMSFSKEINSLGKEYEGTLSTVGEDQITQVYVDNSYTDGKSTGSPREPFKSIRDALGVIDNNVGLNLINTGTPYREGNIQFNYKTTVFLAGSSTDIATRILGQYSNIILTGLNFKNIATSCVELVYSRLVSSGCSYTCDGDISQPNGIYSQYSELLLIDNTFNNQNVGVRVVSSVFTRYKNSTYNNCSYPIYSDLMTRMPVLTDESETLNNVAHPSFPNSFGGTFDIPGIWFTSDILYYSFFNTDTGVMWYWLRNTEDPLGHWVDALGNRLTYSIEYDLEHLVATNDRQPVVGSDYVTAFLVKGSGYSLPQTITVEWENTSVDPDDPGRWVALTGGTDYLYDSSEGTLRILGAGGTGGVTWNVRIIASGVPA